MFRTVTPPRQSTKMSAAHRSYLEHQVSQLSQRDRAAGWVSFGQKWKTIFCRQYSSIFNHCDVIGLNNHSSSSQETRLNDLSYSRKIWTDLSFVLSQIMRFSEWWTDRQTDGHTDFSWLDRVACNPCSAVKMVRCYRPVVIIEHSKYWYLYTEH